MKIVAVIMTWNPITTNRLSLLERAYETLHEADALLVLDNGSTDGSAEFVQKHYYAGLNLTTDKSIGRGMNLAINAAISQKADIVLFSADDMAYFPGWRKRLEEMWKKAGKEIAIICPQLEPIYEWNTVLEHVDLGGEWLVSRRTVPGSCWSFRASDWPVIGPVPEVEHEDVLVCDKIRTLGRKMLATNLAIHYGEGKSTWGNQATPDGRRFPILEPIDKEKIMNSTYYDQNYFDNPHSNKGYPGYYTLDCVPWKDIAFVIRRHAKPEDVADFGCAKGFLILELQALGISVQGYDYSDYALATAPTEIRERLHNHDITSSEVLPSCDTGICMDVLEHIAPEQLGDVIARIEKASQHYLYVHVGLNKSQDDIEVAHLSNHTREEWIALLTSSGDFVVDDATATIQKLYRDMALPVGALWADRVILLKRVPKKEEEMKPEVGDGRTEERGVWSGAMAGSGHGKHDRRGVGGSESH